MGKRRLQDQLADSYRAGKPLLGWAKRAHLKLYKVFHFHLLWLFQLAADRLDAVADRLDDQARRADRRAFQMDRRISLLERSVELNGGGAGGAEDPLLGLQRSKEANAVRARRHRLFRDERVASLPVTVNLAGSSACNLHCVMCSRSAPGQSQEKAVPLDPSRLRDFADQVLPTALHLRLNTSGEPLLSPTLDMELELARRHAVRVLLITNGAVDRPGLWGSLVPLCGQIDVSLDSPVRETYETIRSGAAWARTIGNLMEIRRIAEELPPARRPRLHLGMLLMRSTVDQLPAMVLLCRRLGFDGVRTAMMIAHHPGMEGERVELSDEGVGASLAAAAELARGLGVKFDSPVRPAAGPGRAALETVVEREWARLSAQFLASGLDGAGDPPGLRPAAEEPEHWPPAPFDLDWPVERTGNGAALECPFLWEQAFIDNDARILPCCEPSHPVVGEFDRRGFEAVWNGDAIAAMRGNFNPRSRHHGAHPICSPCAAKGYLRNNF